MSGHVPALPIDVDPLIAEAKQRARRRRLIAFSLCVAVGVAAGATLALRSSGGAVGLCADPPSGWKERDLPEARISPAAVVLTNFRFGRMDDFHGLATALRWPAGGVMIAVSNEGPAATPPFRPALRVTRADFRGFEGLKWPVANVSVRSEGRVLDAYVEARTVTPATVAAANQALAGVRTCSV
jgi:hypothetical protein